MHMHATQRNKRKARHLLGEAVGEELDLLAHHVLDLLGQRAQVWRALAKHQRHVLCACVHSHASKQRAARKKKFKYMTEGAHA